MDIILENIEMYANKVGSHNFTTTKVICIPIVLFILYAFRYIIWIFHVKAMNKGKLKKGLRPLLFEEVVIEYLIALIISIVVCALIDSKSMFINLIIVPIIGLVASLYIYMKVLSNSNITKDLNGLANKRKGSNTVTNTMDGIRYYDNFAIPPKVDDEIEGSFAINLLIDTTKQLVKEMNEQKTVLDTISENIAALSEGLNTIEYNAEKRDMIQIRYEILDMSDRLTTGQKFSKNAFDHMIINIDEYEIFCEAHPDFKNGIATTAINNIRTRYDAAVLDGGFAN